MKKKVLIISLVVIAIIVLSLTYIIIFNKKTDNKDIVKNKEEYNVINGFDVSPYTEYIGLDNPYQLITLEDKKYMLLYVENNTKKIKQMRNLYFLITDSKGNVYEKFETLPTDVLINPGESRYFLADLGNYEIKNGVTYAMSEVSYLIDSKDDMVKPFVVNGYDISVFNNCKAHVCFNGDGLILIKAEKNEVEEKKYEKAIVEFMNEDETEILETIEIYPDKTILNTDEMVYFVAKIKDYKGNYNINKAIIDLK